MSPRATKFDYAAILQGQIEEHITLFTMSPYYCCMTSFPVIPSPSICVVQDQLTQSFPLVLKIINDPIIIQIDEVKNENDTNGIAM